MRRREIDSGIAITGRNTPQGKLEIPDHGTRKSWGESAFLITPYLIFLTRVDAEGNTLTHFRKCAGFPKEWDEGYEVEMSLEFTSSTDIYVDQSSDVRFLSDFILKRWIPE